MKIRNATPSFVEYHALRGTYGRVSYFVTKTTLRDVAENLALAPQDALAFGERIQRLINERRVQKEILPYLKSNDLRFFNALVCILLPDTEQNQGFWNFVDYTDDTGNSLGGLGKLQIAKNVGRVVLDGQHRYEALRQYWEGIKNDSHSGDSALEVALIFVVVDNLGHLGKRYTKVRTKTILAVRNLFAVLNKSARAVDKTTLLLIDDSDIANVFTRRMLETGAVDESVVKWVGTQSLQNRDPYFTVIHVVKDAIQFYLRDFAEELDRDYGTEEERAEAISNLYELTPRVEVPLANAIAEILSTSAPFLQWKAILTQNQIHLPQQPLGPDLTPKQARAIEAARKRQLAFTVAGQKSLFRGIIEAFQLSGKRSDLKALRAVVARANKVFSAEMFVRDTKLSNPFLDLLFDRGGRMNFAESVVNCARRVLAIAFGSKANRETVLTQYKEMTRRDPKVIKEFWAHAEKL